MLRVKFGKSKRANEQARAKSIEKFCIWTLLPYTEATYIYTRWFVKINKNRNRSSSYFMKTSLKIKKWKRNFDHFFLSEKFEEVGATNTHWNFILISIFLMACALFISSLDVWFCDQPGAFLISNHCASNPYLNILICVTIKTCPPILFCCWTTSLQFASMGTLFCSAFISFIIFFWMNAIQREKMWYLSNKLMHQNKPNNIFSKWKVT